VERHLHRRPPQQVVADEHPDIAGTILGGGHELANHTYTHPSLGKAPAATGGRRDHPLPRRPHSPHRVPGGLVPAVRVEVPSALILAEAGRAGYRTVVGYDVDPLDYETPRPGRSSTG